MKQLITMVLLGAFLIPLSMYAQDVQRPKNVGISEFDNFKNSSFDIKEESASLKADVKQIDDEVKGYSGVINTVGVDKLRTNLAALKGSKESVSKLNEKLGVLDEQGKTLVQKAKSVKPKMKSVGATKNTNSSVKGLNLAKDDLKAVGEMLDTDIKLITDELKARGEPIE
jgi:vacuolar-type H+-ATPase subunit I/STV1